MYLKTKQGHFLVRQLFLGLVVIGILSIIVYNMSLHNVYAQSSYTLLLDSYEEEQGTTGIGIPTYDEFNPHTIEFDYSGGEVTLSACPDAKCNWRADDAVKLSVTIPDGTVRSEMFTSMTNEVQADKISHLFEVGVNSINVVLVDLMGPVRGLPQPLYLIESTTALPEPDLENVTLPDGLLYSRYKNGGFSKDPVNTFTGAFIYTYSDISIAGRGPVPAFVRSYSSDSILISDLGVGWTHNYNMRLVKPSASSKDVVVLGPQGRADLYVHNADGSYTPPMAVTNTLEKNSGGTYRLTSKSQEYWVFNEIGLLQSIVDRFGNESSLTYNINNQVISVTDPASRGSLVFSYNNDNLLENVTDWIGREVSFTYDSINRLASVTNREGAVTTYGYDGTSQRLTTITDALNHVVVTNTYDSEGRVATQKDAVGLTTGQQTTFSYTTNPDGTKTTTVIYPQSSFESGWNFTEVHKHDESGNLIEQISKPTSIVNEWVTVTKSYDDYGNVTSTTDGLGQTTYFCYDVDYSGSAIPDSLGNLTRRIDPAPYSGADHPVTLYKYDTANNLIQEIPPKGISSTTTVTCLTDLSSILNLVYATDYVYDSQTHSFLESTSSYFTDPDTNAEITAKTTYDYADTNNPGMVTKMIPPRGNINQPADESFATIYEYGQSGPQAGMLLSVTTPLSAITTYQYDGVGRMTSMVEPRGNESGATASHYTWEYVYDDEDRQTFIKAPAPTSGGSQLVTEYRYDAVGNKTVIIDANGQVVRYDYDVRDQLEHVVQSPDTWTIPSSLPTNIITTTYEYDSLGFMTRVIRADGSSDERVTDYEYDGFGRVRIESQYPNWPTITPVLTTTYTYDNNNNLISEVDPLNQTTTFNYDNLNQIIEVDYSDNGTPDVDYIYDFHGNRLTMVDGTGTTSYVYDEWNRLEKVTSPGSIEVEYRYDRHSNRIELIYPDSDSVTYTYDEADRMTVVEDWDNRETTYDYFANGQVESVSHENGVTANYSYDNAGRMTQVWNKYGLDTFTRHIYTLDAVGYVTSTEEVLTDGRDPEPIDSSRTGIIDYQYDGMYRLTYEYRDLPHPQDEIVNEYEYDLVGNRTVHTMTDVPFSPDITIFTYDQADRIEEAEGEIDEIFTHDANGNMIKRGRYNNVLQFFDQANRLTQTNSALYTYDYVYDGDGNRTKIVRGSTVINSYVYDYNRALPVIIIDDEHKYVWGLDLLYADETGWFPETGWYLKDMLGSVRAIVDDEPEVQFYEEYDAFGNEGYSNRLYDQPFKFTGEMDDQEYTDTDYIYLRARYYDPIIGRFISRDSYAGSIATPLSLNRHTYVENNPVNLVDPSGHASNKVLHPCKHVNYSGGTFPLCVPEGVNLDANVRQAKLWRLIPYHLKHLWFANQVREGGVWDYKRAGYEYADFGNFHYGVIGAALGYSEYTLLVAGGAVQQATNTKAKLQGRRTVETDGTLLITPPYGDTAEDQYWVSQGYQYFINNYR